MTLSRLPDDVGENPLKLTVDERNNCVVELDNVMMCERTLQIGFFFDGTRNNMKYDEPRKSHSNVARLFHTFDENRHRGHGGGVHERRVYKGCLIQGISRHVGSIEILGFGVSAGAVVGM